MRKRVAAILAAGALAALGLGACGDDDGDDTADGGDGGTVDVVLSEWIVEPDPTEVDAGSVTFVADNQGNEVHELVVVEAATIASLPTDDDGAVDETAFEAEGITEYGEVEDVASGDSAELTADLAAGNYVLFCNIVEEEEDGTVESHFAEGMATTFTVN